MVNQCDVLNCKNTSDNTKFLSFFRLPWDRNRQLLWLQLMGRMELSNRDLKLLRNKRVCSKHFSHYDYKGHSFSKFRLTENADPSIFEEGVGYRAFQHVPSEVTLPATDNTESIKSEPYIEHVTAEILSVYSGSPLNDPTEDYEEPAPRKRKHSSEDNVIEQLPLVTDSCEDIYDAKDICRLCLQEEDKTDLFPIFPKEDNEELISDVMKCIPVQVDEYDDRLPRHVCKACYKHLLDWFLFCEMCRSTDVTLKQFVNNVHVTDKADSNKSLKKLKVLHDDNISNDCDKQLVVKVPEVCSMSEGSLRQMSHSVLPSPTQQSHCQVQVVTIPACSVDSSATILSMSATETSSKPNSTSIATCFKPSNNSVNMPSIKINSKRQKIKNNKRLLKCTKSDSELKCKTNLSTKNNTKNNKVAKHTANNNIKKNKYTHVSSVSETSISVKATDIKSNTVTKNTDYSVSNNTKTETSANNKNYKLTDDITCSVSNVTETNMGTEDIDTETVTKNTTCLASETSNLVDHTNTVNEANDIKTSTAKDTEVPN